MGKFEITLPAKFEGSTGREFRGEPELPSPPGTGKLEITRLAKLDGSTGREFKGKPELPSPTGKFEMT
jgi:hypothetical protein